MSNPVTRALTAPGRWLKAAFSFGVFRANYAQYAWLPRTRRDYAREVGDGSGSSVVMPAILWLMRTFPEAPIRLRRRADGEIIAVHPMTDLIARPNPYYSGALLEMASAADFAITGNAYWIKARNTRRRPVELWWMPSTLIEPAWADDGDEFISHYEYMVNGVKRRIEREDVVHFRFGMDPRNPRKGLSPLASVLREVFTDDEAANFSASLLSNLGVPGVIISPGADDGMIDPEDAKLMAEQWQQRFGGDKRGRPLIATTGMKAQIVSFSPDQMDLTMLRRLPEERVTAALGIPAIVVGYGVGLEHATYSNVNAAREMAYENNIIPTQRLWAADLDTQLLRDFDTSAALETFFDTSKVRVLQDDQDQLFTRLSQAVSGGWMTVAEARQSVGMDTKPEDEVYLRPRLAISIPSGVDPNEFIAAAFLANAVPLLSPPAAITPAELTAPPAVEPEPQDDADKSARGYELKLAEDETLALERRLAEAVGAALADQIGSVVEAIADGVTEMDLGDVADALRAAIQPALTEAAIAQAAAAATAIGVPLDVVVVNQAALAWARAYTPDLLEKLTDTTREAIRTAIATWLETPGMTRGQLEDLLRPTFGVSRAEQIAITEVTRAVSEGTNIYQRLLADAGIEMERRWNTNADDRVCFPAGTLVVTESGEQPIEAIAVGTKVLTRKGYQAVIATSQRLYDGLMTTIEHEHGKLTSTFDHPIWVIEKGWLQAGDIQAGDCLYTASNEASKVRRVSNFRIGNANNAPSVTDKECVLSGITTGVTVPVGTIDFNSNASLRKQEINAISADSRFLDKFDAHTKQRKANLPLNAGLSVGTTVTGEAAELPICVTGDLSERTPARSAFDVDRRPVTLLATVSSRLSPRPSESLPTTLAVDVDGICYSAGHAADVVAMGDTFGYCERCFARVADLCDRGIGALARTAAKPAVSGNFCQCAIDSNAALRASDGLSVLETSMTTSDGTILLGEPPSGEGCIASGTRFDHTKHCPRSESYHSLYGKGGNLYVYNLQVDVDPTYYAEGVLVHNCPICQPLNGQPESYWASSYDAGPPAHVRCRCTTTLRLKR